jgi:PAS domain S-box-containing protein
MAIAVVIGNLAASFASGSPASFAAFAAAAAALEVLGGAFLLRWARFEERFESIRDVIVFILVAVYVSPVTAGALGSAGLAIAGMIDWAGWTAAWQNWSVGDAMGVLIVAPLLIGWPGLAGLRTRLAGRGLEVGLLIGVLTVLCLVVFRASGLSSTTYPVAFLVLPAALLAAFRLQLLGAAVASLLVSGFALWATFGGRGPFVMGSIDESIRVMWSFMAVTAGTALTVAASVAARDRVERELRENRSWLDLIEGSVGVGTWLWDSELEKISWSEQQHRFHGLEPGLFELTPSDLMAAVAEEDRQRLWEVLSRAAAERGAFELDFRIEEPGGTKRWHVLKGRCIPKDPSRRTGPYRMVGINLDITERKRLEEGLRHSERLASLGTFAAGMAHEINNPLGTILLAAQTAQATQASGDAEALAQALDDIVDDTRRTKSIVQQVLQFTKSRGSDHVAQDLCACIEGAVVLVVPYAAQHGVTIESAPMDPSLVVSGSAIELEQVFVNLLRNAVEACDRDGRVRLEARRSDGEAQVSIHDDGCGVAAEHQPRVFDPFFTTRSEMGGSGLGLSICYGIVEAHGGRIELASETDPAGRGTTVTVALPLVQPGETTPPAVPTGS